MFRMNARDTIGWRAERVRLNDSSLRRVYADSSRSKNPTRAFDQANAEAASNAAAFAEHLFPPELIMRNQSRLRIREGQRDSILREINRLQETATQTQWRIAEESQRLNELLAAERVSTQEVLSQADRVMTEETALKRAQLQMLVRLRNLLSPEQRAMLRGLRRED